VRALIRTALHQECLKHIDRYYEYLQQLHEGALRTSKRLDLPLKKAVLRPEYWVLDQRFNPFKIRSDKALDRYSFTLARKIISGTYRPERAVTHFVPKDDGTKRELNVFQIPDAAVSRVIFKSLLGKNSRRLSAYAYAYREDKNAHDAVNEIFTEWKSLDRVYVAEFDFSKFFDTIDHGYLWRVLKAHRFLCTPEEKCVLEAFLVSESATLINYLSGNVAKRVRGIPQGTSVSLFLANLACWELDRQLERIGVGFARYADDTVIWSESYAKVVQAYDAIRRSGDLMGVPINYAKSQGIHLVSRGSAGEIATKQSVDFLGYRIGLSNVGIKHKSVQKLQGNISFIVYQNLLQPLMKHGIYNEKRLTDIDWDYVVALSQIRRYLYGGLTDERLRKFMRGQVPKLNYRGLMSYFPLVDDSGQLSTLDGWLIHTLKQALRRRERMWVIAKGKTLPGPAPSWIEQITKFASYEWSGHIVDLRVPSFSLINAAMQIAIGKSGIHAVAHPASPYY
jgi:RNA-directed DNA polymerase